jgi:hypothetical protein
MTTLSITDLFTPALSGVGATAAATPPPGTWYAILLQNAATLGLPTTSWQPGDPTRTILAVTANSLAAGDGLVSLIAQGGFLDYAASGTVTYTAPDGTTVTTPVTPDPSIPAQNPTGALGWLDVLASSVFQQSRILATYATGQLYLANTSGSTYSLDAGTFHVGNQLSGATYTNQAALTIPGASSVGGALTGVSGNPITVTTTTPHGLLTGAVVLVTGVLGDTNANGFWSVQAPNANTLVLLGSLSNGTWTSGGTVYSTVSALFAADVAGPTGTSAPGAIQQVITTEQGVSCYNVGEFVGNLAESNTALASRCRLGLQALSVGGPGGKYQYFALQAVNLLALESPPVSINAITRVVVQSSPITGITQFVIANAQGAVHGSSNVPIQAASYPASPIQIQANGHQLVTNDTVTVTGVTGNTAANGTYQITFVDANNFTLNGTTANAAYTGGGTVEGGDLGQVDRILQENAVPDDTVTLQTASAEEFDVAIVAIVSVPAAYVAAYTTAVQLALKAYFSTLAIGGIDSLLQYNDVVGVLYAAGIFTGSGASVVSKINGLTLNGVATDISYPSPIAVAELAVAPAITVVGT